MATVSLARDRQQDRLVALKILHPELAGAIGVERFIREIRLTSRLQHPNIVPILDSGTIRSEGGPVLPWFAMPFLEGETLRARSEREGPLPVEEALRITRAVGSALSAAHGAGIVHRDIKPENVVLVDGHVYVLDFGIAKALFDTEVVRLTSTGVAIGTPAYMSPEQATADPVDARSDQYSLATLLYEMLVGEPPFSGPTAGAIMARRLTEPARPLVAVRPTVPPSLERAALKALERVPADRFPDVAAFCAALDAPEGVTRPAPIGSPRPRHRNSMVGAGLALLALIGGGAWWRNSHLPQDRGVSDWYRRGRREYERRTPTGIADAIAVFDSITQRAPAFVPAWTGLAKAYMFAELRGFDVPGVPHDRLMSSAIAAVDHAWVLDSGDADAWLTQGIVNKRVDPANTGTALAFFQRSLAIDPNSPEAWHFLAMTEAERGDLPRAVEGWRHAVDIAPGYTWGLSFLAQGEYWHHRYDEAKRWADSAIATDPNYLIARTEMGYAALARKDLGLARTSFEAAKRLSAGPELFNAEAGLALVDAAAGDLTSARARLRRVETGLTGLHPIPDHTVIYVAGAYVGIGERARALEWIGRLPSITDLHVQIHLRCDAAFDPMRADPRFTSLLHPPATLVDNGC
jgi:serine/threonine protein kinase/Flp pilus assembly protein TadD